MMTVLPSRREPFGGSLIGLSCRGVIVPCTHDIRVCLRSQKVYEQNPNTMFTSRRGVPRDDLSNEDKEAPSKPNAGPKKATKLLNKDTDEVEDEVSRKLTNGRRKSVRVTEDDDEEEEEVIHLDDTPVKSQARQQCSPENFCEILIL